MNKLTARKVATIKEAGMYNDGGGLYLQVTPPDGKSWILRTKVYGKTKNIGLGSAHLVSLAEAREEARRLRKVARSGGNPLAERRKASISFEEAARRTHEAKLPGWKNGKHRDNWMSTLERYAFPLIGERDIETLASSDIMAVLSPIWHDKAETARRVRQRLSSVFKWAKSAGYYPHENPVDSVTKEALGEQTDRVNHFKSMKWQDLPAFMEKLAQRNAMSARALQFLILCASRTGEVRFAKWADMDLEQRVWTVPPEKMKGRKGKENEHRVPLSKEAISILRSVHNIGSQYVFPSQSKSKDDMEKPMSENAMLALLKRLGISDVTGHGFRTSFRVWGQECRIADYELLERCIAHKVGNSVSQSYARSDQLELRRPIMEAWGQYATGQSDSAAQPNEIGSGQ